MKDSDLLAMKVVALKRAAEPRRPASLWTNSACVLLSDVQPIVHMPLASVMSFLLSLLSF